MKRDWTAAREKVEAEGRCRVCGGGGISRLVLEAAHIIGREHDNHPSIGGPEHIYGKATLPVMPVRIVPLCRHMRGRGCHPAYDAHELDLLPYLTVEEQAQAVLDAGGIELARRRTAPLAYRSEAA